MQTNRARTVNPIRAVRDRARRDQVSEDLRAKEMREQAKRQQDLEDAKAYLNMMLEGGPRPYREILRKRKEFGISMHSLKEARKVLGIKSMQADAGLGLVAHWAKRNPTSMPTRGKEDAMPTTRRLLSVPKVIQTPPEDFEEESEVILPSYEPVDEEGYLGSVEALKASKPEMRVCSICDTPKELTKANFWQHKTRPGGFETTCKECRMKNKSTTNAKAAQTGTRVCVICHEPKSVKLFRASSNYDSSRQVWCKECGHNPDNRARINQLREQYRLPSVLELDAQELLEKQKPMTLIRRLLTNRTNPTEEPAKGVEPMTQDQPKTPREEIAALRADMIDFTNTVSEHGKAQMEAMQDLARSRNDLASRCQVLESENQDKDRRISDLELANEDKDHTLVEFEKKLQELQDTLDNFLKEYRADDQKRQLNGKLRELEEDTQEFKRITG